MLDTPAFTLGIANLSFTPAQPFELEAGEIYWVYVEAETDGNFGWISSNTPPSGPHASHVGYNFNGSPSNFMNKYSVRGTPAGGCPADLDGDGDADVNDFFLYLDLFASGDPLADITGDGVIDINDFFAYLDLFEQGCP